MGGVTNRKCTCAQFNADLAMLAKLYTLFHTRFSLMFLLFENVIFEDRFEHAACFTCPPTGAAFGDKKIDQHRPEHRQQLNHIAHILMLMGRPDTNSTVQCEIARDPPIALIGMYLGSFLGFVYTCVLCVFCYYCFSLHMCLMFYHWFM